MIIMQTNKSVSSNLIGAILFGVLALLSFINLIRYFSIWNLFSLAAYAYSAAMLVLRRRDALLCAGFGVLSLLSLRVLVMPYGLSLAAFFQFLGCVAMTLLVVAALTNALPALKAMAGKLWFVPAVCMALMALCSFFTAIQILFYGYGLHLSSVLSGILMAAAFLFSGMWCVSPEGIPSTPQFPSGAANAASGSASYGSATSYAPAGGTSGYTAPAPTAESGYYKLSTHVLLLIFTFGIWYLIWIYRVTGYLNQVEDEPPRNPTTKLLLCIFIPFYGWYWTYKSAQRIDKLSAAQGIPSDISTLCLILAIFVGIVPPILMQDKINALATAPANAGGTYAQYTAAAQPQQAAQAQYSAQPQAGAAPWRSAGAYVDVPAELKKYKELLDMGAITQEEFEAKKKQLLEL